MYQTVAQAQAMEAMKKIQDELFLSIRERNLNQVKEILTLHPELVNAERVDFQVSTPLMEACFYGRFTKLKSRQIFQFSLR